MKIALTGGYYQAPSIIADAQSCINLFPQKNPPDSPYPYTHYPTSGLTLLNSPPVAGLGRGAYAASNGNLYVCIDTTIYAVGSKWVFTSIGTIATKSSIVSFADNFNVMIIVDGLNGYAVDLSNNAFTQINDSAFYPADTVEYLQTYFILNRKNTNEFFISLSNATYAQLSQSGGSVQGGIITAGRGYSDGTYTNVSLTGGTGSAAQATIIISGGIVTTVTITNVGYGYSVGDTLGASTVIIGVGTGFQYTVTSVGGAFYPLDFASKVGYSDLLVSLIVMYQQIWLLGAKSTEIWYNSGNANFTFQQLPQGVIEHGLHALNSLAKHDVSVFWLSQDEQGRAIVRKTTNYVASKISTNAIETQLASYSITSDAIGFIYQQSGNVFYFLTFPTANVTWVYEVETDLWHQRAWLDSDGGFNRHRAVAYANAYNTDVVLDWQNGKLYKLDENAFTDNGSPIVRVRSFPHIVSESKRLSYLSLIADMDVGRALDASQNPQISLSCSDDKGVTYGNPLLQNLGNTGAYSTNIKWWRLGMARDRVFKLSWSVDADTALNGVYIEVESAET